MISLSAGFRKRLLPILIAAPLVAAAQDTFFEIRDTEWGNIKSAQLSKNEDYLLVSRFYESEFKNNNYTPERHEGIVYELSSGKEIAKQSSTDIVQWLPGSNDVVLTNKNGVSVVSLAGETVRTIDTRSLIKNGSLSTINFSNDGSLLLLMSERDSLWVYRMNEESKPLKLNTKVAWRYSTRPQFLGRNRYISLPASTFNYIAWDITTNSLAGAVKTFWMFEPMNYYLEEGDSILVHLNSMKRRKSWEWKSDDMMDPSGRFLSRTYNYSSVDVIDLITSTVIQTVPVTGSLIWNRIPGEKHLVIADGNEMLRFYNLEFGEEIHSMKISDLGDKVEFHRKGALFYIQSKNKTVLYELGAMEIKKRSEFDFSQTNGLRFSESGNYLVGLVKGKVTVARTKDGVEVMRK